MERNPRGVRPGDQLDRGLEAFVQVDRLAAALGAFRKEAQIPYQSAATFGAVPARL